MGAIAGSVLGGLAVIGLAFAFLLWRRLRSKPNETGHFGEDDPGLHRSFYNTSSSGLPVSVPPAQSGNTVTQYEPQQQQSTYEYSPYLPSGSSAPILDSGPDSDVGLLSGVPETVKHTYSNNVQTVLSPGSSVNLTSMPSGALSNHAGSQTGGDTSVSPTAGDSRFTDEQADFINTLHANQIPAFAIARVMGRMLSGAPPSAMRGQDWMVESGVENLAPPSYEQHTRP